MKHNRPLTPIIVIVVLVVLVGGYFGIRALLNRGSTALTTSGTIEAVEVTISPEIGGKIVDVSVEEGASVREGDVLFRLDDSLLRAQRTAAAASLDLAGASASTADAALVTAQATYDLTLDAARLESAGGRTADWRVATLSAYSLPGGYFSQWSEISAAQVEVDNASSADAAALDTLTALLADPANAAFAAVETRLVQARAAGLVAQDVLRRATLGNNTELREAAQTASDTAQTELDKAQAAYDGLKASATAGKIITARAALSVAQERLASARDRLLGLQTGENSPKVAAAQAALHQSQAVADQAHLAVSVSKDNLSLLDVQIGKLTVKAPADGVILTRSIQPGEIVAPGASAMILGRISNLTITVYVPEDRYGELSLAQSATLTVDSFPGENFSAAVIHIADQAEFTPRNVQTAEGRSSTVFAIKLQVQDPKDKLKPGMPADVTFGSASK